ncbi:MAG: GtrA family protein [Candidatus Pacebacteria bacterium]|nr:GtrA family protein [Candidatus Paceibacterota bacterium]MBP9842745.1 GtrA family protein [Candidatus Paceibacterota bacterium]
MIIEQRALIRFIHYSFIGAGTFAFDLLLLYIFTDVLSINYLVSVGIAFLIAVSLNYQLSRRFVFKGTTRKQAVGYLYFIIIALLGLLFVTGSMYVLVEMFGLFYLLARIIIAGLTGVWNYLINLFFNFKVAGVYGADLK